MVWWLLLAAYVVYCLWWFDDRAKKKAAQNAASAWAIQTNANKPGPKITFTIDHTDQAERLRTPSRSRARQPGPCTLTLFYVDMAGELTRRDVSPYKSGATNQHFDAYCTLRKDRRTFFFDGIDHGIDLTTGEILSSDDIFKIIHPGRTIRDSENA